MIDKDIICERLKALQDSICADLEAADGRGRFHEDLWTRAEGGGGRTRIIREGNVIEKGGVLFSAVYGPVPDFLKNESTTGKGHTFFATGVSIVIHPENPFVPIIHMNVRYFEMSNGMWWFGGGIDLTPHYIDPADARFFHSQLKAVCDKHNSGYYEEFKKNADDYFFIPHRNETRGVGGIFFDKLGESRGSKEELSDFIIDVGNTFAPTYTALISKNREQRYDEHHKKWQLLRRGRYVEFNLVYDKGTRFGLETNGRTESILMSLPKLACWEYDFQAESGSAEAATLAGLKKGIDWL